MNNAACLPVGGLTMVTNIGVHFRLPAGCKRASIAFFSCSVALLLVSICFDLMRGWWLQQSATAFNDSGVGALPSSRVGADALSPRFFILISF